MGVIVNFGFLAFLFSFATFILSLPELVEKLGKTLPFLISIDNFIQDTIRAGVNVLPAPDPDLGFVSIFFFWPNIATVFIGGVTIIVFLLIAMRLTSASHVFNLPWFFTLMAGIFVCIYLSQIWLLHRSSSLSLWESAKIISYPGRFQAADDKAYFLHGSNIYGFFIFFFSFAIYFLIVWLWRIYQATNKRSHAGEGGG